MDRFPALAQLIAANEVPDPSELLPLRQELRALDEEVDMLRQRLAQLERARGKCLVLLSPLHHVPVEVLGIIISFAVDIEMSSTGREGLIRLCLVSRAWRQAALVTPSLWSNLKIEMQFTPLVYDQAERWFLRSGALPRTLAVVAANDTCRRSNSDLCQLGGGGLPRFLTEGPSISDLAVSCYDSICLLHFHTSIRGLQLSPDRSFVSRSFSLTFREDWDEYLYDPNELPGDGTWHGLPAVTTFALDLPSFPMYMDNARVLRIPSDFLHHLTSFNFGCDWEGSKILGVLQSCHNLEVLALDFKSAVHVWDSEDDFLGMEDALDGRVVFPKLRTLRFRELQEEAFSNMARYLSAPVLSELDLELEQEGMPSGTPAFGKAMVKFLLRRAPGHKGLSTLRLSGSWIPGHTLRCVFEGAKLGESLDHLAVEGTQLGALTPFFSELGVFAPKVRKLEIFNLARGFPAPTFDEFVGWESPPKTGEHGSLERRIVLAYEC